MALSAKQQLAVEWNGGGENLLSHLIFTEEFKLITNLGGEHSTVFPSGV